MNSIKLYCDRCTDAALVAHDIHTKHRRWLSCDRPSRYLLQTECNWQAIGICSFAVASPELVQKEIWTHILAYNLTRPIMAQAASKQDLEPRTISLKGAVQTLEAIQAVIDMQGQRSSTIRIQLYDHLLNAIAVHRVANRPDRFEPRLRKQRHKR